MTDRRIPREVEAILRKHFPMRLLRIVESRPQAEAGDVTYTFVGLSHNTRANDGLRTCSGCDVPRMGGCRNTSCGGYVTLIEPTMEAVERLLVDAVTNKLEGN